MERHMEESLSPVSDAVDDDRLQQFAVTLQQGRQRAREALAAQRERFAQLEDQLRERREAMLAELESSDDDDQQQERADLARQHESIAGQAAELAEQQVALQQEREALDQREEQLAGQRAELDEARGELERLREAALGEEEEQHRQLQREHERRQTELDELAEELERTKTRLTENAEALEAERAALEQARSDTRSQRRRIARRLRQQHEACRKDFERQQQELAELVDGHAASQLQLEARESELQAQLQELQAQRGALAAQQAELDENQNEQGDAAAKLAAAEAELAQVRDELAGSQSKGKQSSAELQARQAEVESLRAELESLQGELSKQSEELSQAKQQASQAASSAEGESEQLARLRAERNELIDRLAEAESRPKSAAPDVALKEEVENLQRRLEFATADVRELKAENVELKQRLSKAGASGAAKDVPGGALDWEAQKQLLLAALDEDFDENDEEHQQDRLTIEGTIRITDDVVASKDREIKELQQLLEQQSNSVGEMAIGAHAIAEMLDHDELVLQERERLKKLQTEWEEKLRKAEIDISVERAKVARQRAALEAKVQAYETRAGNEQESQQGNPAGKPTRGKWLARLGLKDAED